jgi:hypothetical protein
MEIIPLSAEDEEYLQEFRRVVDYAQTRHRMKVMCPLLQLPRSYDYLAAIHDPEYLRRPERDVLLELSRLLYPDCAQLIADSYLSLGDPDTTKADALIEQLGSLIQADRLGRPGAIGRRLFPDSGIAAHMLLLQPKLHAAAERFYQQIKPETDRATCARLVGDMLDAYLAWDCDTGWHDLWGPGSWQLGNMAGDDRFDAAIAALKQALGDEAAINVFFDDIRVRLEPRFDPACVSADAVDPIGRRVLGVVVLTPDLARDAQVTASALPDADRYPPRHAIDGDISMLY